MKSIKKFLIGLLCLALLCSLLPSVFAASESAAVIDYDALCSLTLYKYDFTNAAKDGVWSEDSFISTGYRETYVEDTLGNATREGADSKSSVLGNSQTSDGYAIKGVVFTYLRVADVMTYSEVVDGVAQVNDLYGFTKGDADDLLAAIGLYADGAYVANFEAQGESENPLDQSKVYYDSDTLNKYLYNALVENATVVKDNLEVYVANNGGTAMDETDDDGKTIAKNLPVGLYLLVETSVPEMVTSTTDPFFVSLPMTTVDGNSNSASATNAGAVGGHFWNYDVVLYPKNETGITTLEKTVREAVASTGTNEGSESITDGYSHNATASAGDTLEWQIISTLPTVTSQATALTDLHWVDTLEKGMSYVEWKVTVRIYSDTDCTNLIDTWAYGSDYFDVSYASNKDGSHTMTVTVTEDGLALINGQAVSENVNGELYTSYSNYTVRITYTTTVNSDNSFTYGDEGNCNLVVYTWKRTNSSYYDTLVDDAHVYSYGIDMLKLFSDIGHGTQEMYDHVKFLVYNVTDGYWVQAKLNADEGVYYVTGFTDKENLATEFSPVTWSENDEIGHIVIKGLEDDEYMITETETYNGYTLLTDHRYVEITVADDSIPCDIYSEDILGVIQNDPRYSFDGDLDLELANIPQTALAHNGLTASATVDGVAIEMLSSAGSVSGTESANALAYLEITNHVAPSIPKTGDNAIYWLSACGVLLMTSGLALILLPIMKRRKDEDEEANV